MTRRKREILNKRFATVGKNLAGSINNQCTSIELIDRISPTVMEIEVEGKVSKRICPVSKHIKQRDPMTCPQFVRFLTTIFQTSARTATLPKVWKEARIAATHKKYDEAKTTTGLWRCCVSQVN